MQKTEFRNLPREFDPFECDWPWQGMGEKKPRRALEPQTVRSTPRSASFERDLERVLAMFSTEN